MNQNQFQPNINQNYNSQLQFHPTQRLNQKLAQIQNPKVETKSQRKKKAKNKKDEPKRIRFKEYRCIYPNCDEGLKTKYNCISHIWDIHLKEDLNDPRSFKSIELGEREVAKQLCLKYLQYCPNVESSRKRKPYDCPELFTTQNCGELDKDQMTSKYQGGSERDKHHSDSSGQTSITTYQIMEPTLVLTQMLNENEIHIKTEMNPTIINEFEQQQNIQYEENDENEFEEDEDECYEMGKESTPYCLNYDPSTIDMNTMIQMNKQQQIHVNQLTQPISTTETQETSWYINSENDNSSNNNQMITLTQHQRQELNEMDQTTRSIPMTNQLLSLHNDTLKVYTLANSIQRLHVYGEVFAENGFLQRSDKRSKKNIETIKNSLETLCKITGKSYHYKNDEKQKRYGFIAQELKEVIPEAVVEDEDGMLSIDPLSLLPFIIEALKELDMNIKKVTQTTDVIRLSENVKESLTSLESIENNTSTYSLGPSEFVIPMGIASSIISALVAIHGNFPFIWIFLVFAAICYFASHQFAKNGKFTTISIALNFVILNILLVCIAASFLMGTVLQVFLGIYLSTMLLLWGIGQSSETSCLNYFIVSFSFSCITCWILFMLQPTFTCDVSTPMKQNSKLREYLEYNNAKEVQFSLTSDIPWNCFNPRLEVSGKRMKFIHSDRSTSVTVDPNTLSSDQVDVKMVCSSIEYQCDSYYVMPTSKYWESLHPNDRRKFDNQ